MARKLVYLASQLGFAETTKKYVLQPLKRRLEEEASVKLYDPFEECPKLVDVSKPGKLKNYEDVKGCWEDIGTVIAATNIAAMQASGCMAAILDGGHAVDDGVASEIGYYAGIGRGPIFALRSDFRLAENVASRVNVQISGFIRLSGGKLFAGKSAENEWVYAIRDWAQGKKRRR